MARPSKLRLSPTRIGTFLACRVMYKYDYIDRIGRFYHKASAGNSFGSTLHQALHDFHVAGGVVAEDSEVLAKRAIQSWRSAGYRDEADEERHRELAISLLQSYHNAESRKEGATRVFLAEKMIAYDMGDFILTGRVDRIDEHLEGGALEIVDYKSGRTSVTPDEVRDALAMSVYQLILKRLYPERRVMATIHALRSGESATIELSDTQLTEWESELRHIGERLLGTDWESVRPTYLENVCPDCDFLRLCTRYWKSEREAMSSS
jgi:putative RecB family exonuclease